MQQDLSSGMIQWRNYHIHISFIEFVEQSREALPGIETIINYGDDEDQRDSIEVAKDESNIEINDTDVRETKDVKLDQLDEEKRLREEVKKSFQKATHREPSCHVRIDNFQRPLTLRTLVSWLEEKSNIKVDESNVWVNNIKTHCYVTFQSTEESKLCKETIEGLKYPTTNPLSLVVHYTKLPASEAAGSPEAALKLQEWVVSQNPIPSTSIMKRLGPRKENSVNQPDPGSSLGKRKSLGQGSGIGGAMFGVIRNTLTAAASAQEQEQSKSPRANRNATPRGLSVGQSGLESVDQIVSEETHVDRNSESNVKNKSRSQKLKATNSTENQQGGRKELTLDDFFKKTVATPQLYWLPVSDEEVERRRQQKTK